ncbi:MAG: hypothetical protein ACI910_000619 [Oleispira sp.]|jgi:hypothetical protein
MNILKAFVLAVSIFSVTACGTLSSQFTETGDKRFEPLSETCPVNIYTTRPEKKFYELGVIDINFECAPFGCEREKISSAGSTRDFIAKDVCKAGGNAILLWESTYNLYMKATVIRVED